MYVFTHAIQKMARPLPVALLLVAVMLLGAPSFSAAPVSAQGDDVSRLYTYMPSANETGARMVAQAGNGIETLVEIGTEFNVVIDPAADLDDAGKWELGVFDGDSNKGSDPTAPPSNSFFNGHWDLTGKDVTQLLFKLYADENGNVDTVNGADPLYVWTGNDQNASTDEALSGGGWMPDNAWFDITLPTHAEAYSSTLGVYQYRLRVEYDERLVDGVLDGDVNGDGDVDAESAFMLRTTGLVRTMPDRPFQFLAPLRSLEDLKTVYPGYLDCYLDQSCTETTYDGNWDLLFIFRSEMADKLEMWDGDFDRGQRNDTNLDEDDLNTANALPTGAEGEDPLTVDPPFFIAGETGGAVEAEGIAFGPNPDFPSVPGAPKNIRNGIGDPPDDTASWTGVRSPAIEYTVIDPNGVEYHNTNPSGNREWERFSIGTSDCATCDRDGDGVIEAGVDVDHLAPGPLPTGFYRLMIDGMDMSNINALRVPDFVFAIDVDGDAELGNRVWRDNDQDGVYEPTDGETPIDGVTVTLVRDINLSGVIEPGEAIDGLTSFTTTTDANGQYLFTGLADGQYIVVVEDSNFDTLAPLDGLLQTTTTNADAGSPVDATDLTATEYNRTTPYITRIINQQDNYTADFGYFSPFTGSSGTFLGNQVWLDIDPDGTDGVYDFGTEPGIGGVELQLWFDLDGNGLLDPLVDIAGPTQTTGPDGQYIFTNLLDGGTYIVEVLANNFDPGGALEGLTKASTEFAGPGDSNDFTDFNRPSPYAATVNSPTGNFTADFAYVPTGRLGDRVWFDDNADGVQDAGEAGIPNVDVTIEYEVVVDGSPVLFVQTTTTDGNGEYLFENLPLVYDINDGLAEPVLYDVFVETDTLPAGVTNTYDFDDGVADGTAPEPDDSSAYELGLGEVENLEQDFGYVLPRGSIGDRVWFDDDADGVQDAGEAGIPGVDVRLACDTDGDGTADINATDTTDGNGEYLFTDLPAGSCKITVVAATLPSSDFDNTFDFDNGTVGDADGKPGDPDGMSTYELGVGENERRQDFGYVEPRGSIGDRVWFDDDADGVQDAGEAGIPGVDVTLACDTDGDGTADINASDTTDGNGEYLFTDLPAGSCKITVVAATLPAGVNHTYDFDNGVAGGADGDPDGMSTYPLGAGEDERRQDFGYDPANPNPNPDCSECDGKVTQLEMRYDGASEAQIRVETKKDGTAFEALVAPGGTFSFSGTDNKGTLGTEIEIFVDGASHVKIHTSCSQPIGPGLVAGDFTVISGESRNGGLLCPVEGGGPVPDPNPNPDCSECDGKVTQLEMRYDGASEAQIRVETKKDGTAFEALVAPGGTFSFSGTDKKGTLGTEIEIFVDGASHVKIHTSCSQPIGPGLVAGDFTVISGESRNGGLLCPVGTGPVGDPTGDFDCDKPIDVLVMIWNGASAVDVKVWKGDVGSELLGVAEDVTPGDAVRASGYAGSPNDVYWEVFDATSGAKLGESAFHMSCSDDAMDGPEDCGTAQGNNKRNEDDLLNDWLLAGMTDSKGSFLCLPDGTTVIEAGPPTGGGPGPDPNPTPDCSECDGKVTALEMRYDGSSEAQIRVETKKEGSVFDMLVAAGGTFSFVGNDKKGTLGTEIEIFVNGASHVKIHTSCSQPIGPGLVAGDFTVISGESRNGGLMCPVGGPGPDPTGDFDCDKPIDVLVMIWNGASAVDVKVWKGDVGSELLGVAEDVTPGDAVRASGYAGSPNDVYWEVFDAASGAKLGESAFHMSCSDDDMDGPEDCGTAQGNNKRNEDDLLNDWLLAGMTDSKGSFLCLPDGTTVIEAGPPTGGGPGPDPDPNPDPGPADGTEGCTPGYWKQKHHHDSWVGYDPDDDRYDNVFDVNAPGNDKLKDAVKKGGGGEKALKRHAVAALLNAASPDVDYGYSVAEVIAAVQAAYESGEFESTKDAFETENERGCPLN